MVTGFLSQFPIRADLAIMQGDPYPRALGLRTNVGLVDTAGWWGLMQIRDKPVDQGGVVLAEASTANGRIVMGIQGSSPNQWNLLIDIPSLITSGLTDWGIGVWQLQAGPSASSATTYFGGNCWLVSDVAF